MLTVLRARPISIDLVSVSVGGLRACLMLKTFFFSGNDLVACTGLAGTSSVMSDLEVVRRMRPLPLGEITL